MVSLALDPGFGSAIGRGVGAIALYAVVGLILMVFGFYAIDWTTPGKLSLLVRGGCPNAVIVTAAGMFSMALIVVVAIYSSAGKLDEGLLSSLIYGLVGIIVQVGAVRLLEWITRLDIGGLIEDKNFAPASVVVASAHVALGLVVAVAIS
ncbi:DUF350 domain-containing protein [Lentzea sp. NBRC 105346]|uniref:DUF350 domain-containing protein n=1 Tax=Lentzea sp. NBRC 105346 TaxID=3032205 RepID=UPI0024A2D1FA|nr:DUF350 domain-containing protein [Lentzea sp. NBRC 105346]GLZ32558.1 DUF350 domain-containing protein [Lentzea sp. NBRC 105346]